ncbi:MAG: hypothetical protein Q9218_001214 [Villophora microphyllina]
MPSCLYILAQLQLPAQAANADTIVHQDHNHHRLLNVFDQSDPYQALKIRGGSYEPEFAGLDRGIIGRAPQAAITLDNNAPQPMGIDQGDIHFWTFPQSISRGPLGRPADPSLPLNLSATNTTCLERDLIRLAGSQSDAAGAREIYLTLSTCDQPTSTATNGPPQLEVYVSLNTNNQQPDKGRNDQVLTVDEGYGNLTLPRGTGDVWIGVRAPTAGGFDGSYNYELAASIDAPYATFFEGEYLRGDKTHPLDTQIIPLDTDTNSSILGTGDITNELSNSTNFVKWMDPALPPPFNIYVHNRADPALLGLTKSICALRKHAQVQDSVKSMVKIGGQPNQHFYVNGLNKTSSYNATMTLERPLGNSTIGGGGSIWRATNFTTKSDNNCQIIYDLPFCSDVAYAVPSNLTTNMTELAQIYNNYTRDAYQNFDKSLQQIPCDTTPSAQYSLARNCTDCANAYKAWLCAVSIPRCADFSSPPNKDYLFPRNINSTHFINGSLVPNEPKGFLLSAENKTTAHYGSSRSPDIINQTKPGPYKEMLPCKDLCYHLMQNCPAALQFACPLEGRGLNFSYGHWKNGDEEWMCNWPGGPKLWSGAGIRVVNWGMMVLVLAVAIYVS